MWLKTWHGRVVCTILHAEPAQNHILVPAQSSFLPNGLYSECGGKPKLFLRPISVWAQEYAKHSEHLVVADHAGSGKTLAYLIPIVQALRDYEASNGSKASKPNCPTAVIVAPTQELCAQVHLRLSHCFCKWHAPLRPQSEAGL
jgi:hypothetical protein